MAGLVLGTQRSVSEKRIAQRKYSSPLFMISWGPMLSENTTWKTPERKIHIF